VADPPLSMPL